MTLFDENRTTTGRDHPPTSHQAAERVWPRSGTQRATVLMLLYDTYPGGLTDEEMQTRLHMNPNTQRPRRGELVKQGWVRDAGYKRETRGGDPAIVWTYRPDPEIRP